MKFGKHNPNWRGGKTVSSHGYVLVRVGNDHHLADVRGYAYEHRLVAERKIGRRLRPGEIVHHIDGDRRNNAQGNIAVKESIAHHRAEHRRPESRLRGTSEPNPTIECSCGCGATFSKFDHLNRPRGFVSGHNMRRRF